MDLETIENSLMDNVQMIWSQVAAFVPSLVAALLLLVGGYFISKLIGKLVTVTLGKLGFDRISERVGLSQLLVSWKMSPHLSHFLGRLCFLFVFMVFLISTADVLEMDGLSKAIDKFVQYLPNIVGALFVFFMASIAGHYAREAIAKASASMSLDFGKPLSQIAYYALLLIGAILAVGQLKIETAFLTHVIEIVLVSVGVAVALSLGIGSRDVSKNLISGVYLKESLREGCMVRVGDFEGELVQIKPVSFELKDKTGGTIILPNSRLLDCEIIQRES